MAIKAATAPVPSDLTLSGPGKFRRTDKLECRFVCKLTRERYREVGRSHEVNEYLGGRLRQENPPAPS